MKLNFAIAGHTQLPTHSILDLCDYLTAKVLEPAFRNSGWEWERCSMSFFAFDNTCSPLDPTGTIRFAVPPLFAGQVGQLEQVILRELANLKIQTGPLSYDRHPVTSAVREITIPITSNPTAQTAPPDVNISQTRGCLVLRDLLGYEKVNGRYEFAADELLRRVSSVTEAQIAACTASPVWDPPASPVIKRLPSPVSMKAIARALKELQLFAQWALSHNYRKLAAA